MFPTIIIRHRKENLKKCSLRGLERKKDFLFLRYPIQSPLPDLSNYVVLSLEAPVLSYEDQGKGILLIDGTWNHSKKMIRQLPKGLTYRSLPKCYKSAYPRKQTGCSDPQAGLASIEALFLAYQILGRENHFLLDNYYWKEDFLHQNRLFSFSGVNLSLA